MPRKLAASVGGAALALTGLLCGCSSTPGRPEIFVATSPPGAACTLIRLGKPIAMVSPTPAIALVDPSADAITITCTRAGFAEASTTLPAEHIWPGMTQIMDSQAYYSYQRRVDIALHAATR